MPKIKVTSPSFSSNTILRENLLRHFPDAVFNENGERFTSEKLVEYLQDADGAIVGLEKLDAKTLDSLERVKILSKYGVGLDNIDVEYAKSINKVIGWQPGVNRRSVSELALCFILGLCRNVFQSSFLLKKNEWKKEGGFQLSEKTVGLVGCGFVGEDLLKLLQPFGCRLLICDVLDKTAVAQKHNATQVDFDTIISQSDVVSLHVPLTPQTQKMISEKQLNQMKSTSYLINTSRGPVVDQKALKKALINGQIAGAALDVFEEEPPSDAEFLSLSNLMITPHIGGNAVEAVIAMGEAAIENLVSFFGGR